MLVEHTNALMKRNMDCKDSLQRSPDLSVLEYFCLNETVVKKSSPTGTSQVTAMYKAKGTNYED